MDFYIASSTLKKIDVLLNNYKKRILKDFYELHNLDIDYQKYENQYLERKNNVSSNTEINVNKCHAYIWKKKIGKVQCSRSQSINNFCKIHCDKQNYGTIDN